jgi:chromosome partitioning protein
MRAWLVATVSVMNYKGGVGKTTIAANLAADLAQRGQQVLLIDLDPQSSLTFSFYAADEWETSLSGRTVMQWYQSQCEGKPQDLADFVLTPAKVNAEVPGRIDLIPSHLGLVDVELDIAALLGGSRYQAESPDYLRIHRLLASALETLRPYDHVIIDCPPSFNMVTRTAIVASGHILVPAKADYLSIVGITYLRRRLRELLEEYEKVSGVDASVNPSILGVVFTMVQYAGSGLMLKLDQYIAMVRQMEAPTFEAKLRESKSVFADNAQGGIPAVLLSSTPSNVAYDLREITAEFLARTKI